MELSPDTPVLGSVGAHVRDAAAYVCWAVARAYAPQTLAPILTFLAPHLLVVACFDREVRVDMQYKQVSGSVSELSWYRARMAGLCPSAVPASRPAVVRVSGLQLGKCDSACWSCVMLCMSWQWWARRVHGDL